MEQKQRHLAHPEMYKLSRYYNKYLIAQLISLKIACMHHWQVNINDIHKIFLGR